MWYGVRPGITATIRRTGVRGRLSTGITIMDTMLIIIHTITDISGTGKNTATRITTVITTGPAGPIPPMWLPASTRVLIKPPIHGPSFGRQVASYTCPTRTADLPAAALGILQYGEALPSRAAPGNPQRLIHGSAQPPAEAGRQPVPAPKGVPPVQVLPGNRPA